MFQALLGEVRSGVIDRVFRYLPRLVAAEGGVEAVLDAVDDTVDESGGAGSDASRSARKRHKKK